MRFPHVEKTQTPCILILGVLVACLGLFPDSAKASKFKSKFIDPNDGKLDASNWLLENNGFLPVPMLITEPAVGYGGGAAILFFHEQKEEKASPTGDEVFGLPPGITGVAAAATENGTWGAGLFHFGSWHEDRIRYQGMLLKASVNLTFYGGGNSPLLAEGLDYNLDGWFTSHSLLFRIKDTDLFLGGEFTLFDSTSSFDTNQSIPGIENAEMDFRTLGLGPTLKYDSRDNIFTPNRGMQIDCSTLFNGSESWYSSDQNYQKTGAQGIFYFPYEQQWVLGWRLKGDYVSGDAPFFTLPFIQMRGIPAMRYQGHAVAQTELEFRYNIDPRWSVLGFGGIGKAANSFGDFTSTDLQYAVGTGFRYLLARKMGLFGGVDIARGPEQWVFYFTIGSAWNL